MDLRYKLYNDSHKEERRAYARNRRALKREETNEKARQYRKLNPDRLKQARSKYYYANRELALDRTQRWRDENREDVLEAGRIRSHRYYVENRSLVLLNARLDRVINNGFYCLRDRQNYKGNIELRREKNRKDGRLRREAKKLVDFVYERNIAQHGILTCYLCLKPILNGDDNLEHKIPVSRCKKLGLDPNTIGNLDVAHASCNLSKLGLTDSEYRLALIR